MATTTLPNSYLGANSFVAPKQVAQPTQAVQPGLATYSSSQLGGLQPLLSDLLTPATPPNKYLAQTYQADPEALKKRLEEYSVYDLSKLGGLGEYIKGKSPLVTGAQAYFKPEEFEKIQSGLSGLTSEQVQSLAPLLGDVSTIGSLNDIFYYEKPALEAALGKYGVLDASAYAGLSKLPEFSQLSPLATLGDTRFYDPEAFKSFQSSLSNYAAVPEATWKKYADVVTPRGVNPIATLNNQVLLNKAQADQFSTLAGVSDWLEKINPLRTKEEIYTEPIDESGMHAGIAKHLGQKPTVRSIEDLKNAGYQVRTVYDAEGAPTTQWYRTVQEAPLTVEDFWKTYGATPEGGWSDSNTKGAGGDFWTRRLYKPPLQQWMKDPSYLPNFSLYGSGSPEDIQRGFNILQRMSPQNIHEFWLLSPEAQRGMLENPGVALQQMRALANPANKDWLSIGAEGGFNTINAYNWDSKKGLTADPSQYMTIHDEGPFGDNFITDILDNPVVNTALSVIPVTAPYMAAYNAVNAIHNDNPLGAALSAAGGLMSATGFNPAAELGKGANKALELGLGKAGQMSLGGSLYGAGMGALQGGDLKSALTGAVTGGLGGYASGAIPGLTKGMSPLVQYAANIGAQTGIGGLSSLLSGRKFDQGALSGLIGGTAGALSGAIGKNYGGTFGAISNPIIKQMLARQLYKV